MPSDVVCALLRAEKVEVSRVTKVGASRGWSVAEHIVTTALPMWCVAAGVEEPAPPAVGSFADLPAIHSALDSIDASGAIHLAPDVREEGRLLAARTMLGPLRAVETALDHCRYDPRDVMRLCAVWVRIETLCALLGALALDRHDGPPETFDSEPWDRARDALATALGG